MSTQSVTKQPINIVHNLPFEIIAVPNDNDYQRAFQKLTNQKFDSFKIRIKNKKEPGVKRAVISVPKLNTSYNSKKVRLVNSDQTILSFDLFMDAPASKRTQKKKQRNIFQMFKPGCLNAQNKDDNDPYTSTSCNSLNKIENISDNNINNHNENGVENFPIRKKIVLNDTTTKPLRSFLGQCKPGGCLDPPYNEDKYPYKPTDGFSPLSLKADFDKKINHDGKLKSRDEVKAINTNEIEAITNDTRSNNIVSSQLRDEENDDNMPNSLITYPHAIPSSEINITRENQNKNMKPRTSSESKPKFLVNEFPEVYYMPPKKTKIKRPEAKYNKYKSETPPDKSKTFNFLIKNEVTTSITPVQNTLQGPELIKDDYQPEHENIKETSQEIKKLFHYSSERKNITSSENSVIPVLNDKIALRSNKKSSVELVPVEVEDRKFTTKTLSLNGSNKYFEKPSTSDDINKNYVLPDKQHKDIKELNNLINVLVKSSETQIKTNSKDLYVKKSDPSLKACEVPSSNKQSIHELVDTTPTRSISMISNIDVAETDSKHINVLYEDEELFDISLKTSLESLEQIDSIIEMNKNDLSAISEKDKNNQVSVIMPISNNTDNQIIKPEMTPEHMTENILTTDSKQAIDETLFTKQTRSLNKSQEKLTDTSLNADNRAPNIDITITPSNKQIYEAQLRQDITEIVSAINNDTLAKIKQLKYSSRSFQESFGTLKVNDINQKENISLQSFEFQDKEIHALSPSLDTLANKSKENRSSNIELADVNSVFFRTKPKATPKLNTKSVHSIENAALEIKHSSREFMKQNNDTSVLNSALNSPVKGSDTRIHFESDNIVKTYLEDNILKDLNNEEKNLKGRNNSITHKKTPTQQSFVVDDGMRPVPVQVEMDKFATANNMGENNYYEDNDKMKYNKISNVNYITDSKGDTKNIGSESSAITKSKEEILNETYFDDFNNNYAKLIKRNIVQSQSFENQQKTNEEILNKMFINSNISSKISLPKSIETVERSITNDTNIKSSLKGNGKNEAVKGTSEEFSIQFQFQKKINDAESLMLKNKYNQNISQEISLLGKFKSPSQSVHKIQAQSKEKTVVSNKKSTVPEVLIVNNNDTDSNVKSKKVEQLNDEKFNEIKNDIKDELNYFTTKGLIDLQGADKNFTHLEYEGQPNVLYTEPHKKLNSSNISSIAINFGFRVSKNGDNKVFIQTYDPAMPIKENLEETVTTKTLIRENEKEIRIHINSETDLTLRIAKTKIPTKKINSMTIIEENKNIYKTSSSDKTLNSDTLLQEKLNSVYDNLVPLQEIISNLTEEVKLLSQQQMFFGQLLSKMETKPLRILNTNQTCKCNEY